MMPLTFSPPLVLADADGDAAVVAGIASAIPAASAPVTFDFMVSPGIADTAHHRGAAHPSHPREILVWILACRGVDPWRLRLLCAARSEAPAIPEAHDVARDGSLILDFATFAWIGRTCPVPARPEVATGPDLRCLKLDGGTAAVACQ